MDKVFSLNNIINSNLTKIDANWGRILCAVYVTLSGFSLRREWQTLITQSGYTPLPPSTISPEKVSVSFIPSPTSSDTTPLRLLTNGEPEPNIDEGRASVILSEEDLEVEVDLGGGNEEARVWTCDFSHVR